MATKKFAKKKTRKQLAEEAELFHRTGDAEFTVWIDCDGCGVELCHEAELGQDPTDVRKDMATALHQQGCRVLRSEYYCIVGVFCKYCIEAKVPEKG